MTQVFSEERNENLKELVRPDSIYTILRKDVTLKTNIFEGKEFEL